MISLYSQRDITPSVSSINIYGRKERVHQQIKVKFSHRVEFYCIKNIVGTGKMADLLSVNESFIKCYFSD